MTLLHLLRGYSTVASCPPLARNDNAQLQQYGTSFRVGAPTSTIGRTGGRHRCILLICLIEHQLFVRSPQPRTPHAGRSSCVPVQCHVPRRCTVGVREHGRQQGFSSPMRRRNSADAWRSSSMLHRQHNVAGAARQHVQPLSAAAMALTQPASLRGISGSPAMGPIMFPHGSSSS